VARGLDKVKLALDERRVRIAQDLDLQRIVRENTTGVKELLLQLDAIKTESFRGKLQAFCLQRKRCGKTTGGLFRYYRRQLRERFKFFYQALAPELELYRCGWVTRSLSSVHAQRLRAIGQSQSVRHV